MIHKDLSKLDSYKLGFHNGCFLHDDLPDGVRFSNAVNDNGFLLFVPARAKIAKPIHIICMVDEHSVNLRNSVVMETGSSAELLISYVANSNSSVEWGRVEVNFVTEVTLAKSATLNIVCLQKINNATSLTTDTVVEQDANSRMNIHYINMCTEKVQNSMKVNLNGLNAEHYISGLSLTQQSEHVGNNVQIVHASPECQSNQLFKQILSDTSTGIFTGRIIVNKDSQKTAAYQRSSNIVLNNNAKMKIRPQLEIYADDVKCSHGATVGQLDAEALFYLRSRGIGEEEAKNILLRAFASEVIERITSDALRNNILEMVSLFWGYAD